MKRLVLAAGVAAFGVAAFGPGGWAGAASWTTTFGTDPTNGYKFGIARGIDSTGAYELLIKCWKASGTPSLVDLETKTAWLPGANYPKSLLVQAQFDVSEHVSLNFEPVQLRGRLAYVTGFPSGEARQMLSALRSAQTSIALTVGREVISFTVKNGKPIGDKLMQFCGYS